jgi:hypothetical protein
MSTHSNGSAEKDLHLAEVLDAYAAQLQAGTAPPLEELLARHPELAEDLRQCLPCLGVIQEAQGSGLVRAEAAPEDAGPLPQTLGDFRILGELGRGGMGMVYRAEQVSLRRAVALSRCCRRPPHSTRGSCSASTTRPGRLPVCTTATSCPSSPSAARAASTFTPCS